MSLLWHYSNARPCNHPRPARACFQPTRLAAHRPDDHAEALGPTAVTILPRCRPPLLIRCWSCPTLYLWWWSGWCWLSSYLVSVFWGVWEEGDIGQLGYGLLVIVLQPIIHRPIAAVA